MRRTLAISMLLLFSFALISPLFASDVVQASLPACCRRAGKHHCSMATENPRSRRVSEVAEKCPCLPAASAAFHPLLLAPPAGHAVFAELVSHPAIHAQTAAHYRISFDRSRQKRGPPNFLLL